MRTVHFLPEFMEMTSPFPPVGAVRDDLISAVLLDLFSIFQGLPGLLPPVGR